MHKLSETNWQYKNMGRRDKGFVCGPGLRLGAMGFAFNTFKSDFISKWLAKAQSFG